MRITTRGRYALRAALAMARLSRNGEPISIRRLAEEEGISSVFLEQIFYRLRKSGLVESIRGPGGGFAFSRELENLSVKDILLAAGESMQLAPCGDSKNICAKSDACVAHQIWSEATKAMNDYFAGLTLKELNERFGTLPDEAPKMDSR